MQVFLPKSIGYGRLDGLIDLFDQVRGERLKKLRFNWSRTESIAPAGFAILACLFDTVIEQKIKIENVFVKQNLKLLKPVQNLIEMENFSKLPDPSFHDFQTASILLNGNINKINSSFSGNMQSQFQSRLSEDTAYFSQLILNELIVNAVDHSTAERYYIYSGIFEKKNEFHVGVLDMGVTIPAKLEQKYECSDDKSYLELALKSGTTTRRQRTGGMGLHLAFESLKKNAGTFILVSRTGEVIRYFKNKKVISKTLKKTLHGTWCLARFPLGVK